MLARRASAPPAPPRAEFERATAAAFRPRRSLPASVEPNLKAVMTLIYERDCRKKPTSKEDYSRKVLCYKKCDTTHIILDRIKR